MLTEAFTWTALPTCNLSNIKASVSVVFSLVFLQYMQQVISDDEFSLEIVGEGKPELYQLWPESFVPKGFIADMKFMKLGAGPDTFYTEEATRTVLSDVPSDLTIRINNITYLLHKYSLLPKCGLLQRLSSEKEDSTNVALDLHDIPGGDEAFELCAKFCYGISINLSAHNFVSAFCAAKFLRMTEAVENGNLIMKLEAFFSSCILEGWKDSVVTLQNTQRVYEWSENLSIVRRCIESIVDKILTPPAKVRWSYTYTRPGYAKKRHQSVPKDWWTEDISFLDIDMFRCIVTAVKSTNILQPQLIGEALHVYACRWLLDMTESQPNKSSSSQVDDSPHRKQRILETIVGLIPADKGSVSIKFLLRLLSIANFLGVSPVTKAELLRISSLQLEEATLDDLLLPTWAPNDQTSHDTDLVKTVLESFLRQWRRQTSAGESQSLLRSIHKIGKLVDSYLLVVAKDANLPFHKFESLIETLPGNARPEHNDLYKAINTYLKEHPDLSKTDKKQICRFLDCQKLSPEVRAHAVKNELLPLRTVVQVLFYEQEKKGHTTTNKTHASPEQHADRQETSDIRDELNKLKLSAGEQSSKGKGNRSSEPGTSGVHRNLRKSDDKQQQRQDQKLQDKSSHQTRNGERKGNQRRGHCWDSSESSQERSSEKSIRKDTQQKQREIAH
ncbi:BTB/POZ domain-containing protein At5g47800 isoform X2 [Sesamum indicum]|uniref:BTB/POZ domain-containing protein At5g47800 isoform X2 n=1 Tax=Sesamum indicum TaxID=4182 RepID=A0A6I9TLF3_SESIN|nr:BTB/POZ domain-containing protein At5g47800 isoform X2 [Sesamum indicum]